MFNIQTSKTPEKCLQHWQKLVKNRPTYPVDITGPDFIWVLAITQTEMYNEILRFRSIFLGEPDFKSEWFRIKTRNEWKWDVNQSSFLNTLNYLWWTRGNGVYIILSEKGHVEKIVLFKNLEFDNDWPENTLNEFRRAYNLEKRGKLLKDVRKWSASGCLLRSEDPIRIQWDGYNIFIHMFQDVAKKYKKNVDFFFHRKDHPVAPILGYEPFFYYTGSFMTKIKGVPTGAKLNWYTILANGYGKLYAERPIPTTDEWLLVTQAYFPPDCRNSYINSVINIPWEQRESRAVWRGGLTNCGFDDRQNIRLRLIMRANKELMDVRATGWGGRMKAEFREGHPPKVGKIQIGKLRKKMGIELAEMMPRNKQQQFKYIIDIAGNNENPAYRFAWEMMAGFVILWVGDSCFAQNGEGLRRINLWFWDKLKPWEHYIPVSYDLNNLEERIRWCQNHDDEVREIAKNVQKLGHQLFTRQGLIGQVIKQLDL